MRSFVLPCLLLALLASIVGGGCFWGDGDEPEYAPVRAYAGMSVESFDNGGGTSLYVTHAQEGHPAALAGVDPSTDIVVGVDGEPVTTPQEFYARLEDHHPGDLVTVDIERLVLPIANGLSPKTNPISLDVELIEEPLPDALSSTCPIATCAKPTS